MRDGLEVLGAVQRILSFEANRPVSLSRPSGGRFPRPCEAAKLGGFRADFAGEKIIKKSLDGPLLFLYYYGQVPRTRIR